MSLNGFFFILYNNLLLDICTVALNIQWPHVFSADTLQTVGPRPGLEKKHIQPDLDSNCFDAVLVVLKDYFEKVDLKRNGQMSKKTFKITANNAP